MRHARVLGRAAALGVALHAAAPAPGHAHGWGEGLKRKAEEAARRAKEARSDRPAERAAAPTMNVGKDSTPGTRVVSATDFGARGSATSRARSSCGAAASRSPTSKDAKRRVFHAQVMADGKYVKVDIDGQRVPNAANVDEAGRQKNRRVAPVER